MKNAVRDGKVYECFGLDEDAVAMLQAICAATDGNFRKLRIFAEHLSACHKGQLFTRAMVQSACDTYRFLDSSMAA